MANIIPAECAWKWASKPNEKKNKKKGRKEMNLVLPPEIGGIFWCMIGSDPSVSKSNRLHVVIFCFFSMNLRVILYIPLN
jgi:hypothetical protein